VRSGLRTTYGVIRISSSSSSCCLDCCEVSRPRPGILRKRQTAQAPLVGLGDHSRYHRRFTFLEQDPALVLAIQMSGMPLVGASQSAELYLQLERYIGIVVNQRLRLERESNVLIIDGREGRGVGLIPDDRRDGRIVINRRKTGVEDGIALSQLESGVLLLGGTQLDVLELRTELSFMESTAAN
jgi:hypothetical protein